MHPVVFQINNKFIADSSINQLTDIQSNEIKRIEPRLMQLLCLLVENQGLLVDRETIVREIWKDYPGAGESLNQAISILRKLLDDDHKAVIRTVPKSGYLFIGSITEPPVEKASPPRQISGGNRPWIVLAMGVIVVILLANYLIRPATIPVANKETRLQQDQAISQKDSLHQAEMENRYK